MEHYDSDIFLYDVKQVFSYFVDAEITHIERLTSGNVNDTYKISAEFPDKMNNGGCEETHAYILQKMNGYAYSSPVCVMENASMISEHLKKEGFALKTPNYCENKFGEKVTRISPGDRGKHENAEIQGKVEKMAACDEIGNTVICDEAGNTVIRDVVGNVAIFDDSEIAGKTVSPVEYWRLCDFIDSTTYNKTTDTGIVKATGSAFGCFEHALRDFDASRLNIVIPDFHDTVQRYNHMTEAYEEWLTSTSLTSAPVFKLDISLEEHEDEDVKNRISSLIAYLISVRSHACELTYLQHAGKSPLRVVHNDTKINNVLFERTPCTVTDTEHHSPQQIDFVADIDSDNRQTYQSYTNINQDTLTTHPLAIIDLDTCMPGLVAHDFGDGIRYAAGIEENGQMTFNMENFEAFCDGFIPEVADFLTQEERDTLYLAPFTMAVELSVRYLTDFFEGNKYFHTDFPLQNLQKAEQQAELSRRMLRNEAAIRKYVSEK